jgi:sulfite exporter TauE/SafE
MQELLQLQNTLLSSKTALLPLLALGFSFLNSWHCSLMCGPLAYIENPRQRHLLLFLRIFSYTLMGFLMGWFGSFLRNSLELQIINALSFLIFFALTCLFILPELVPALPKWSLRHFFNPLLSSKINPTSRGFLMAFIPCHLLSFYYAVAALNGSALLGAGLLFGHAVMTTPALAYYWKLNERFSKAPKIFGKLIKVSLIFVVLFNLFYFAGHLFHSPEEASRRLLFCF